MGLSWKRQTWRLVRTIPSPCWWPLNGTDIKEEVVAEVASPTKDPTMDNRRLPISIPSLVTSPKQETRNPYQREGAFNIEPSDCVPMMFSYPDEVASQTRDLTAARRGTISTPSLVTSPMQKPRNPHQKEAMFNSKP